MTLRIVTRADMNGNSWEKSVEIELSETELTTSTGRPLPESVALLSANLFQSVNNEPDALRPP